MMQKLLFLVALVATLSLTGPAYGNQADAPDVLLKALTAEIVSIIARDKDIQAGDARKLADLVEGKIVPVFDFGRMTRIAVARNWSLASPEQQKALITEFQTLLVRTYSTVLTNYRNQTIEFKALGAAPTDVEVTVKSVVRQPGTAPLPIDYQMGKTPSGWKVYEIRLDGVDLIANYRESFAAKVRDAGVDGLIKALRERNHQNERRG